MAHPLDDRLRRARNDAVLLRQVGVGILRRGRDGCLLAARPLLCDELLRPAPGPGRGETRERRQQVVALGQPRQVLDERPDDALVTFEKRVARPLHVLSSGFVRQRLGLVDVHLEQVSAVLGPGLVAVLLRHLVVVAIGLLGWPEFRRQHDVRIPVFRRPGDRVAAHDPRDPDLRVRRLVGTRPGVDVAVVIVLAFPAERPVPGPRRDDEVVRLLEPVPVVRRHGVVRDALAAGSPHPARHQAAAGDHVDGREIFRQPQRVVPDRQDVAEQHDLRALGDAREDGGFEVHHLPHAERRRVVFVQHQAVEPHFLRVQLLVEVAVVEVGAEPGVVGAVGHAEVHDRPAGVAEVAGVRILVGTLREVADEHV